MEDDVGRLQITVADIRGHLFPLDIEHSCSVELLYEEGISKELFSLGLPHVFTCYQSENLIGIRYHDDTCTPQ
jgi:hypothetical protein